jgi:hypothetical protein
VTGHGVFGQHQVLWAFIATVTAVIVIAVVMALAGHGGDSNHTSPGQLPRSTLTPAPMP